MRLLSVRPVGRLIMRLSPPSAAQVERFAAMVGEDLSRAPELRDMLVAMQRLPGVQASIRELLHAVVRLRGARPEVALTAAQLARIAQPVQLIWGERDPFGGPRIGKHAAAIIPDAEFHVLPGAGHVPWIAQAGAVSDLAAPFLRAVSSSA
jgi:pimeloyl-ACP methyl ester carboxylesterase